MSRLSLRNLRYSPAENLAANRAEVSNPEFFSSAAFSKDGFIEHQQALASLRYAARNSAYCGCGWIAVWNFFRASGKEIGIPELINKLEPGAVLGGSLGTDPFFVKNYLKRMGEKVFLTFSLKKIVKKAPKRGIVFYWRKDLSGHFAAFSQYDDGLYRFYNHKGSPDIESMEEFAKNKKHIFTLFLGAEQN